MKYFGSYILDLTGYDREVNESNAARKNPKLPCCLVRKIDHSSLYIGSAIIYVYQHCFAVMRVLDQDLRAQRQTLMRARQFIHVVDLP